MNRGMRRTVLLDLNLFLGVTAVAGGVALLTGWIKMPLSSLAGSPFSDYTVPAMLLVVRGRRHGLARGVARSPQAECWRSSISSRGGSDHRLRDR